jgi:hypothetical protein
MAQQLEEVITSDALRTAIRDKVRAGITRRAISELICRFVPAGTPGGRDDGTGVIRLPVELIRHDQRAAFLCAVSRLLPEASSPAQREMARVVGFDC